MFHCKFPISFFIWQLQVLNSLLYFIFFTCYTTRIHAEPRQKLLYFMFNENGYLLWPDLGDKMGPVADKIAAGVDLDLCLLWTGRLVTIDRGLVDCWTSVDPSKFWFNSISSVFSSACNLWLPLDICFALPQTLNSRTPSVSFFSCLIIFSLKFLLARSSRTSKPG